MNGHELRPLKTPLPKQLPLLPTTVKIQKPLDFSRNFQLLSGNSHQSQGSLWCRFSAASRGEREKLSF